MFCAALATAAGSHRGGRMDARGARAAYNEATLGVGLARVGQPTQRVVAGTLAELRRVDFGGPLHSLVLVGEMHALEAELVRAFMVTPADLGAPPEAPPLGAGSVGDAKAE